MVSEGTTTPGGQASAGPEVCKLCPAQGTLDLNTLGKSPLVFSQGTRVPFSPAKGCPCPRSPSSTPEALLEAMNIWTPRSTLDQECHLVATELIKIV